MSGTDVRFANSGDVPALLAAYDWLFAPPASQPDGWDRQRAEATLADMFASEQAAVFVADAAGQVIGFCTVYLDIPSVRFGQRSWVEDLAVHPERRSTGIGRRLLAAAKGWARERGATHLELDSATGRVAAHRFYEREQPSWRSVCFGWELA